MVIGVASAEVQSVVASACVYCIQAATNYSSHPMGYIFVRNIHNLYDMYACICVYACMYMCMYIHVHIYMCVVCIYAYICSMVPWYH